MKKLFSLFLLTAFLAVGNVWAEEETITLSEQGYTNAQVVSSTEGSVVTLTYTDGGTATAYYNTGTGVRVYSGGKMTVTASDNTITQVVVTFAKNNSPTISWSSNGTSTSSTTDDPATWEGSATSVDFNVATKGHARIQSVTVTYTTSGISDPAVATTVTIDHSGITNTNVYAGTAAGSLSATVKAGEDAIDGATVIWSGDNDAVATINANGVVTLVAAGTVTFTASYAGVENQYKSSSDEYEMTVTNTNPNAPYWGEVALENLTSSDIFVIVGNNGSNYALSNDKGTGSAPSAVEVTISDGKIVGNVADNIKWNISGNAVGYTFFPNGTTESWLYCTNTNNGVRVGTNDNKAFTINDSYLYNTGTSRYVGVYQSQDWRCYTSINSNISGQSFKFYKYTDPSAPVDPSVATTVTIDHSGITNTNKFLGTAAGSLTAIVKAGEDAIDGATVTWSSSNDEVATIAADGTITLVAAGTVTFTASYAGVTDTYKASSAIYEMTVTNSDPNAPGTVNNPYTVAQAIAYIETLGTATSPSDVYVSGIISKVDGYNSTYGSITYWISDDGTTTNQMEVYSGLGLNGVQFSAETDLQVGDIVTVKGTVKMFNSIPEFNYNNQLVSFNRPVSTDPSISVSATEINATAAETVGTIAISYENITISEAADFDIQFYDANEVELDGENKPDWVAVSVKAAAAPAEGYVVSYIIDANDDAARTAYFKVYALGDDLVYSNLVTINQEAYVAPFVIKDGEFDFNQGEDYGSNLSKSGVKAQTSNWTAGNVTMIMAGRNCWNDYNEVGQIRLYKSYGDDAAGNITFSVPAGNVITGILFEGASLNKMNSNVGNFDSSEGIWLGVATSVVFTAVDRTDIFTITVEYAETASLTLGTNGWSTFAADFAYSVSGAEVYKAAYSAGVVMLSEISGVIPAEQGIILKGEQGAPVTITPSAEEVTADFTDNQLVGVVSATVAPANAHVLATIDDDNVTKFHPCDGIEIPAHKAYMEIAANGAPVRIIFAENNATAIQNLEGDETAVKFIENGKLYIRKNGVVYDATGAVVR